MPRAAGDGAGQVGALGQHGIERARPVSPRPRLGAEVDRADVVALAFEVVFCDGPFGLSWVGGMATAYVGARRALGAAHWAASGLRRPRLDARPSAWAARLAGGSRASAAAASAAAAPVGVGAFVPRRGRARRTTWATASASAELVQQRSARRASSVPAQAWRGELGLGLRRAGRSGQASGGGLGAARSQSSRSRVIVPGLAGGAVAFARSRRRAPWASAAAPRAVPAAARARATPPRSARSPAPPCVAGLGLEGGGGIRRVRGELGPIGRSSVQRGGLGFLAGGRRSRRFRRGRAQRPSVPGRAARAGCSGLPGGALRGVAASRGALALTQRFRQFASDPRLRRAGSSAPGGRRRAWRTGAGGVAVPAPETPAGRRAAGGEGGWAGRLRRIDDGANAEGRGRARQGLDQAGAGVSPAGRPVPGLLAPSRQKEGAWGRAAASSSSPSAAPGPLRSRAGRDGVQGGRSRRASPGGQAGEARASAVSAGRAVFELAVRPRGRRSRGWLGCVRLPRRRARRGRRRGGFSLAASVGLRFGRPAGRGGILSSASCSALAWSSGVSCGPVGPAPPRRGGGGRRWASSAASWAARVSTWASAAARLARRPGRRLAEPGGAVSARRDGRFQRRQVVGQAPRRPRRPRQYGPRAGPARHRRGRGRAGSGAGRRRVGLAGASDLGLSTPSRARPGTLEFA